MKYSNVYKINDNVIVAKTIEKAIKKYKLAYTTPIEYAELLHSNVLIRVKE